MPPGRSGPRRALALGGALAVAAGLPYAPGPADAQERLSCTVEVPLRREPDRPAAGFDALCAGLVRCWQPPPALAGRAGVEITVMLSLGGTGAVQGVPRPTYTAGVATREERQGLFEATVAAIRRCPTPMSPALEGRIGGHMIFLRVIHRPPQP